MSPSSPDQAMLVRTADDVQAIAAPIFAALDQLAAKVVAATDLADPEIFAQSAAWEELEPTAAALLMADPLMLGCGLAVIGMNVSPEKSPSMAWWVRRDGLVIPKRHVLNPTSDSFYDVRQRTWFAQPAQTRRPVLLAPYVDSWGTDDLTMTACRPLLRDGHVVAVVAADLDARKYVTRAEGLLRRLGTVGALVDSERRVIASTTPEWETGARLAAISPASPSRTVEIGQFGWELLVFD